MPLETDSKVIPLANPQPSSVFLSFMKDMKIGAKVIVGFGFLVLLAFVSAGVSYLGSGQATAKIDVTDEVRVPAALSAARAQATLLQMQSDVRGYLALGDQEYRDSYNRSNEQFKSALDDLNALSPNLDAKNRQRLQDLQAAYGKWSGLPDRLFELRDDQLDREPAYRILATDGVNLAGRVLIDTNSMIKEQGQREPTKDSQQLLSDMARFQGNFTAMLSALRGYTTTRNRIYRQEYQVNLTDNKIVWDSLTGKRAMLSANQQKLIDSISKNRDAFLTLPDQIFTTLESNQWRQDLYLFTTEALPLADSMQRSLNEITNDQQTVLSSDLAAGRADLDNANRLILVSGIIALIAGAVLAYLARQTIAGPISRLTQVAERIRGGDLEAQAVVESRDETGVLAETFNRMTHQLRSTLRQVRREKKRADDLLEVVIPIGAELASEKNFNRLLEKMLLEAKSFCRADAGILYLVTEDKCLQYVIVRDDSQNLAYGGTTGNPVPFAPLPLYDAAGTAIERLLPTRVALRGTSVNISTAEQGKEFDLTDDRVYLDNARNSLLAIPLKNSKSQVLGVLQMMGAHSADASQVTLFDQNLQQMMESFSLLAVAALEAYIREQSLQQQIQQLKIEIDEVKRQKQVSEIVETDFFQDLQARARAMRQRGGRSSGQSSSDKK